MSLATVKKLIALAADERGNLNERQNAALKACEMIQRDGLELRDNPNPFVGAKPRTHVGVDYSNDFSSGFRESVYQRLWEEIYGETRHHTPPSEDGRRARQAAEDGRREAERRRWEAIGREDVRRQRLWEEQAIANDPKVQAQRAYAKGFDAIDWGKR